MHAPQVKMFMCGTCSEVYKWPRWFWRYSNAHGLPDAVNAADVTWGHLASQICQVPSHLLSCKVKRRNIEESRK